MKEEGEGEGREDSVFEMWNYNIFIELQVHVCVMEAKLIGIMSIVWDSYRS